MATRQFFKKAHMLDKVPRVPKPKKPSLKGRLVMVRYEGQLSPRTMSATQAARLLGNAKGGRTKAERGNKAGCFTPDSARKAARKLWRTRWRFNKRIGTRIGMASKRAPQVKRAPLRLKHTTEVVKGIFYDPNDVYGGSWWRGSTAFGGPIHRITERTALIRLGYLSSSNRRIPQTVTPIPLTGKHRARRLALGEDV